MKFAVKVFKWATSRQGLHDLGALSAAVVAVVKGLQAAGVI